MSHPLKEYFKSALEASTTLRFSRNLVWDRGRVRQAQEPAQEVNILFFSASGLLEAFMMLTVSSAFS